jgi:hypothetical protein
VAEYTRLYQAATPDLFTYQDALEHLEATTLGGAMDSERRDFRSAVLGAYPDLASRYDWLYYHTEHDIRLEATYSTGTITYNNTTKQVTIYDVDDVDETTSTWPTNATDGRIKINDVRYPIESRVSNTVIKLPDDINPGVDILTVTPYTINDTKVTAVANKGTTTYTWLRSRYTLPADFKDMDPPHAESSNLSQSPVSLDGIMSFERHVRASAHPPRWYAIGPDPNRYGQMAMYVQYEPNTAEGLRFFYRRFPRRIKYSDSSTGTVSNSGTTVTLAGTGASFSSEMVGSVIRFGTSTTKPSGVRGLNPWQEQRIITAYTDANTVTVDSAPSSTFSGVKYVVSDPLDLRPTMIEPFLRGCEWKLSLSRRNAESPTQELHQWYMEAIRIAGEAEATVDKSWTTPATYNRGIQAIVTPSVSG